MKLSCFREPKLNTLSQGLCLLTKWKLIEAQRPEESNSIYLSCLFWCENFDSKPILVSPGKLSLQLSRQLSFNCQAAKQTDITNAHATIASNIPSSIASTIAPTIAQLSCSWANRYYQLSCNYRRNYRLNSRMQLLTKRGSFCYAIPRCVTNWVAWL